MANIVSNLGPSVTNRIQNPARPKTPLAIDLNLAEDESEPSLNPVNPPVSPASIPVLDISDRVETIDSLSDSELLLRIAITGHDLIFGVSGTVDRGDDNPRRAQGLDQLAAIVPNSIAVQKEIQNRIQLWHTFIGLNEARILQAASPRDLLSAINQVSAALTHFSIELNDPTSGIKQHLPRRAASTHVASTHVASTHVASTHVALTTNLNHFHIGVALLKFSAVLLQQTPIRSPAEFEKYFGTDQKHILTTSEPFSDGWGEFVPGGQLEIRPISGNGIGISGDGYLTLYVGTRRLTSADVGSHSGYYLQG
jgi:hypothetical protein